MKLTESLYEVIGTHILIIHQRMPFITSAEKIFSIYLIFNQTFNSLMDFFVKFQFFFVILHKFLSYDRKSEGNRGGDDWDGR